MPPLAHPPVSGLDPEGTGLELWQEFLTLFFDGNQHSVGPVPNVSFPKAVLRFQEAPLPQPMEGAVGISVVWVAPSKIETYWDTLTAAEITALNIQPPSTAPAIRQQRAVAHCAWIFLVRSVTAGSATDNAQKQVSDAAGKLFGLLQNAEAVQPLAEKGIHKLRPKLARMAFPGDGAPNADLGFKLRVVTCAGVLRYPIVSQATDF
jgi:hypothetical protein